MTEAPEEKIGKILRKRGWTLAVAESCTGGLIGHRLTNVPGSSTYYLGSITAYAYRAKVRLLQVSWDTLEEQGAVSEAVVKEMAAGVRQTLGADVGLSVSGIAGPSGGTADKPVGFVWMGLSMLDETHTLNMTASGDRIANKNTFAAAALNFLVHQLENDGKN